MKEKNKSKNTSMSAEPSTSSSNGGEDKIWQDPRFAHLRDARFKSIHKSTKSVKIDKRFQSMFDDNKFKVKYTIDKYGRPLKKSSTEDLKKYYEISEDELGSDDEAEEQRKEAEAIVKDDDKLDLNDALESDEEIAATLKEKLKDLNVDYARGEKILQTDSSSDDESSEDEDEELFIEHVWGELDNDAPRTDESTKRLAVCNMDWDRMRAADIMVLCNSFLPPGGTILSVTIYPSQYGKERMAEEEIKGPQELTQKKLESDEDTSDDELNTKAVADENEDGIDYNMEKLRQYQLNRLKYYYAVIECNSVSTADKIYAECDGLEYESTATKMDLRFIPDDCSFDEDEPKDVCTELPDTSKYMPRLFTTTALQQAKVELTWDENDVERKELNDKLISGKLNEVNDHELRKYVAYSSEEDENEEADDNVDEAEEEDVEEKFKNGSGKKNSLSKYKELLADINEKEEKKKNNKIEMEFTWGIGMSGKDSKSSEKAAVKVVDKEKTHFEKILELKAEKKKARKVEHKKLRKKYKNGGDVDINEEHSDDSDVPDGIDMNDPYFAEEFANGEFEAPKKVSKKQQRKNRKMEANTDDDEQREEDALALLLDDDEDDKKSHFSLKKIQDTENETKTKRKRKKQLKRSKGQIKADKAAFVDDFEIDTKDNRFAAVYSSHLYSIDPTNPNFKKTKAMGKLIEEKLKRGPSEMDRGSIYEGPVNPAKKTKVEMNMLVKSIKRKVAGN